MIYLYKIAIGMNRRKFLTFLGLSFLANISLHTIKSASANQPKIKLLNNISQLSSLFFYISPYGNDTWSGTQVNANPSKTDGPFKTLGKVRDVIRQLKHQQGGKLQQSVTIYIRGGIYFLNEPLILTHEDSGSASFPILYTAYENEIPVISGGKYIENWQQKVIEGKNVWVADISKDSWFFRQLWVNGERRQRARHPNKGYLSVVKAPDAEPKIPWYEGQTRFQFQQEDLKLLKTFDQAEAIVMTRWAESRLPIKNIDNTQRIVDFKNRSTYRIDPGNSSSSGAGIYYIENSFDILDTPGEWYLDGKNSKIYYLPLPGETINRLEIIAPILSTLIDLKGEPETGKFVEHISFERLSFAHTEWYFTKDFKNPFWPAPARNWPKADVLRTGQASFVVPGSVHALGVQYCLWKNCTMAHMNTYAIELSRGCRHNLISHCKMYDIGGGIKIGESLSSSELKNITQNLNFHTHDNQVTNCHIYEGGYIFHSAVGIWIGKSYNNIVNYNHIHHFYYTGISVGWSWGYQDSLTSNNIIEFNYIHDIGLHSNEEFPILNDKGAIYTLGIQPQTQIRYNVIHDVQSFNFGAWGIYLDQGSSQIVVENNLVYETRDGGFHINFGKDNFIHNNIFCFGEFSQLRLSKPEKHRSFSFLQNIVYWNNGPLLAGKIDSSNVFFDYNLYWCQNCSKVSFKEISWEEWRKKGQDTHSLIANPLFISPKTKNFNLQKDSPAYDIGFTPIPIDEILRKVLYS